MKLVRKNQRGEDVCRDLAKAWCLLRVSFRHIEPLTFLSRRSVPRSGLLTRITILKIEACQQVTGLLNRKIAVPTSQR